MTEVVRTGRRTQVAARVETLSEFPEASPGEVTVAKTVAPCGGCGELTKVRIHGRPGHWICWLNARTTHAPVPTSDDAQEQPTREEKTAFQQLRESVQASRKHPLLRVPTTERNAAPWTLITETMRGEHRYRAAAPAGTKVLTLDRNGSYPSAMGNVPVAANRLVHTGPLDSVDHTSAGIYLIEAFGWPNGPHPLGEIADQAGHRDGEYWISTPHMRLVMRLARDGRIPAPLILDSWTGAAATNLFKQYAGDVADARARTRGTDAYTEVKTQTSIAIRCLWPKGARSPFWRPDWSVSVRAEASVRHWVRADQAMRAGATLVALGSVDEAGFAVTHETDVPEPYTLGDAFGQVKIKACVTAKTWNSRG